MLSSVHWCKGSDCLVAGKVERKVMSINSTKCLKNCFRNIRVVYNIVWINNFYIYTYYRQTFLFLYWDSHSHSSLELKVSHEHNFWNSFSCNFVAKFTIDLMCWFIKSNYSPSVLWFVSIILFKHQSWSCDNIFPWTVI